MITLLLDANYAQSPAENCCVAKLQLKIQAEQRSRQRIVFEVCNIFHCTKETKKVTFRHLMVTSISSLLPLLTYFYYLTLIPKFGSLAHRPLESHHIITYSEIFNKS